MEFLLPCRCGCGSPEGFADLDEHFEHQICTCCCDGRFDISNCGSTVVFCSGNGFGSRTTSQVYDWQRRWCWVGGLISNPVYVTFFFFLANIFILFFSMHAFFFLVAIISNLLFDCPRLSVYTHTHTHTYTYSHTKKEVCFHSLLSRTLFRLGF